MRERRTDGRTTGQPDDDDDGGGGRKEEKQNLDHVLPCLRGHMDSNFGVCSRKAHSALPGSCHVCTCSAHAVIGQQNANLSCGGAQKRRVP